MDTTTTAPQFLESLRTSTMQSHTALEALPVSASIMNPHVTDAEYAHYLTLMHDVVKDAELNIFPVLKEKDIVTGLDERVKAHFLEKDLAALGHPKTEYLKPLSSKIEFLTPAFALGIMYTVEGSSLGGRIILKNINAILGHNAEGGAQYFSGYGGQTGSMWKGFLGQMMAYEAQNNAADEIIAGANFAFDAISAHFTQK